MLDQKKKVELEKVIANAPDTITLVRSFMDFIAGNCSHLEVKDALKFLKTELSTMPYYDDIKQDIYCEMEAFGIVHNYLLDV